MSMPLPLPLPMSMPMRAAFVHCRAYVFTVLQQRSFSCVWSEQTRKCSTRSIYTDPSVYRLRLYRRVAGVRMREQNWCCVCLCTDSRLCGWPNLTPRTKIHSVHPIYYYRNQHIHDELLWLYYGFVDFLSMRCDIFDIFSSPATGKVTNGRARIVMECKHLRCRKNVIGTCHRETLLPSEVETKTPNFVAHRNMNATKLVHYGWPQMTSDGDRRRRKNHFQ